MIREILILDVTAMSGGNVCVAGIDINDGTTIRLNNPQPTRDGLRALGWLRAGEVIRVDVEPVEQVTPPHVEDHRWVPRSVEKVRRLSNEEMVAAIRPWAVRSIEEAFGEPAIRRDRLNCGWKPNAGERSLATLRVRYVRFNQDSRGAIRAALMDGEEERWRHVPFQDLAVREHRERQGACCEQLLLENVKGDFEANGCLVRVGLTRPFSPDEAEDNSMCWLQVTNVFAADREHFV